MKSVINYIFFFLILFGVFMLILNVDFKGKTKSVYPCETKDIIAMHIKSDGDKIVVKREMVDSIANWVIESDGAREPAVTKTLEALKGLYCNIPYVEKFPVSDVELSETGIDQDNASNIVIMTGKGTDILTMGNETPDGAAFYMRSSRTPDYVYSIANAYRKLLFPSFFDLRSRQVFNFTGHEQISVKMSGFNLDIGTDGPLLEVMKKLAYTNYIGPLNYDGLQGYGFFDADAKFIIRSEQGGLKEYELTFFSGKYYFSYPFNGRFIVFILENGSAKQLLTSLQKAVLNGSFK